MKILKIALSAVLMTVVLAVSAFAAVSLNFDVESTSTDTGMDCYKVVVTQSDDVGDWRALQTKISFNYNKIIPIDWYEGIVPSYEGEEAEYPFVFNSFKSGRNSTKELGRTPGTPVWTINGADSELVVELFWDAFTSYPITANETMIYEMYFKLADGVTLDSLVASDFEVYFVEYGSDAKHYYGNEDASKNDIVLTNNVVPEAKVITIPVAADDKVYLQDGTVVTVAAAGNYEVPATVGYVAVNTGYTAQKTYYVDGESATEVHANAVVAKNEHSLRSRDELHDGVDKSGLRFKMEHATAGRTATGHEIVEVGFIMTAESNKILAAEGADYVLDMGMVERGHAASGYAYNTADGTDFAFDSTNDFNYIITGIFYNIPKKDVQTTIAARPYYKVGDAYVYGEITKTCLYDVAVALRASENWDTMSQGQKDYVNEIVAQVDGWTEIVEEEIVIDIGGLYN